MKTLLLAATYLMGTAALAADALDDAYFGRIDLPPSQRPDLINARAVQVAPTPAGAVAVPIFLHVRPGQEKRWSAHCKAYGACALPVYFVKESWYREIYLPRVGGTDGREQRYLERIRVERSEARSDRHRQDD
jgi:hypothetical protein